MGYFANGFVFTDQPDFEAASKIVPGGLARGYKHNQHPIWLLDLWKPAEKLRPRRSPFCDPVPLGVSTGGTLDAPTRSFLTALEDIRQVIGFDGRGPELTAIHLALAVAAATCCPVFFFAADDEETDLACNAVSGSLVKFGGRLDRLSVQYSRGQTAITPLNYLEDGDEEDLQELIDAVRSVPGITVLPQQDVEDGQVLCENPVARWPIAAVSPADILGLGTWDPLSNIEKDFTVIFEKLGP
jgi:hypothetical protein